MVSEGTVIRDRYRLVARLGGGSLGETWTADDLTSGHEVVCKLTLLRGTPGWKTFELFEREAAVLRTVRHPQVPRFLDAFQAHLRLDELTLVLVMERVQGETLLAIIARQERWDDARARQVLDKLLQLLVYLHGLSPPVVHRDIKPANVIMRTDVEPVLVDYGAVRDLGARTDQGSLTVVGTAGYMPPEQALGAALPASDLFALGATMVHALTHTHPADLPRRGMRMRFEGLVGCSPGLIDVLVRLVEPDIDRRYGSAADALADLRRPPSERRPAAEPEAPRALVPRAPLAISLPAAPRPVRRAAEARIESIAVNRSTLAGLGTFAGLGFPGLLVAGAHHLGASLALLAVALPVAWLTGRATLRRTRRRFRELYETGKAVRGRVRSVNRERARGVSHADVTYAYQVNGELFMGQLQHSGDAAEAVREHDPVLVIHDRQLPAQHVATVVLPEDVMAARLAGDE